jgi:Putative addiction module component
MMSNLQALHQQIAELPALDRIALVEDILQGLDVPDRSVDAIWSNVADSRLTAYKSGQDIHQNVPIALIDVW